MKKIITIIFVFLMLSLSLIARERVAVLPFTGGVGNEGDTIARLVATELMKLGNFQIIPRTAAITKVMQEQKFQRSGLTDGDTIVELGKGVNAKYVVSGHIQKLGEMNMISASILNVETFQQIAGDYYEYNDISEVRKYLPTLAKKLVRKTKKNYSGVPTLAILPFDGVDKNNAEILAQLLAIELANSGKYAVVSRTRTVENIMKEQNIQRSGLTDATTISKLGEAINAKYVLSGSVTSLGNDDLMIVEIINVLTLEQENGGSVQYKTIEDGIKLMSDISYKLTGISENASNLESRTPIQLYDDIRKSANKEHLFIETDFGTIEIKFFPDKAPKHAEAIKKLAREGFYDGTTFHRVIPGFMIQGGDPNSKLADRSIHGMGGPDFTIPQEFNDVSHKRGIASMARAQHEDSAGSQFFIMVKDSPSLDRHYTVWGEVVSGMDIVDKIVWLQRDRNDNPIKPIKMNRVYIK